MVRARARHTRARARASSPGPRRKIKTRCGTVAFQVVYQRHVMARAGHTRAYTMGVPRKGTRPAEGRKNGIEVKEGKKTTSRGTGLAVEKFLLLFRGVRAPGRV